MSMPRQTSYLLYLLLLLLQQLAHAPIRLAQPRHLSRSGEHKETETERETERDRERESARGIRG